VLGPAPQCTMHNAQCTMHKARDAQRAMRTAAYLPTDKGGRVSPRNCTYPRWGFERAFFTIVVRILTSSRASSSSGWAAGCSAPRVATMSSSQYRASRASFKETQVFAMKSGFVCPADASARFAPMLVPAANNWSSRRSVVRRRSSAVSQKATTAQANLNARS
jgi:hypothetical protein